MTTTETQAGALAGSTMESVVFHVARWSGHGAQDAHRYAACDGFKRLPAQSLVHASEVHPELRCQRSGCRQRWPK